MPAAQGFPAPQLTHTQQRIYDLVQRRPRTGRELHALIWWMHPQDAPPHTVIKAHVWQLNRKLKPYGLEVRAPRGGDYHDRFREAPYALQKI